MHRVRGQIGCGYGAVAYRVFVRRLLYCIGFLSADPGSAF